MIKALSSPVKFSAQQTSQRHAQVERPIVRWQGHRATCCGGSLVLESHDGDVHCPIFNKAVVVALLTAANTTVATRESIAIVLVVVACYL